MTRVERKPPKDHRHKLAPVAEGQFKAIKSDGNTVTIEKTDRSVEAVSRSRVLLKPKTASVEEVNQELQPVKFSEAKETEKNNLTDIIADNDRKETKSDDEVANENNQLGPNTTEKNEKGDLDTGVEVGVRTQAEKKVEVEDDNKTEEHLMDAIANDTVKKNRRHHYRKYGEKLYCVRWYNCEPDEDTWEPIRHLLRSKVL